MANNYPEWWDTTITVFNKYEDSTTKLITWYKHTITNCFWKYTGDKVVVGETTLETDTTICRVPKNSLFLENYLWEASSTTRSTNFTFSPGDIIVKGSVTDAVDEYTSGSRSTDLLKKYKKLQGCFVVTKCAINVGQGRGTEHYYVKGV